MGENKKDDSITEVNTNETLSFETALEQLEQIVQQLEDGDVPLEQSIALFQRGMHLSNYCNKQLEEVEEKIEILIDESGKLTAKPFEPLDDIQGDQG